MTLGDKIPLYCAQRGWKLADLARRANVDVKTLAAQVARRTRSSSFAKPIADALSISVDELLEDAPPRGPEAPKVQAPRGEYGSLILSPLENQLISLYRGCSERRQDDLLRFANLWFVEKNPGKSAANPFTEIRSTPAARPAKRPGKRRGSK